MSKELELMIDLIIEFDELGFEPTTLCDTQKEIDSFKNRLIKIRDYFKSIENANPSEALECLEFLQGNERPLNDLDYANKLEECFKTIKQVLITKSKKEQAWDIAKDKGFDEIGNVKQCATYKDYKKLIIEKYSKFNWSKNICWESKEELDYLYLLTEEEFDLVKEICKDEQNR